MLEFPKAAGSGQRFPAAYLCPLSGVYFNRMRVYALASKQYPGIVLRLEPLRYQREITRWLAQTKTTALRIIPATLHRGNLLSSLESLSVSD